MGYSSALCVSACTATASSFTASLLDDKVHGGGHGFCPAASMVTANGNFEPLVNCSSRAQWRSRELLSVLGSRRSREVGFRVLASSSDDSSGEAKKGQVNTENVPGWAKPNSEELPPWARNERPALQEPGQQQELPFPVYLIGSVLVSIAAVGSVFEYFNKNPVFGLVSPDSPFYAPILGFFAFTGLPTAGFLFFKSIQLANKASEEADKQDGYRR